MIILPVIKTSRVLTIFSSVSVQITSHLGINPKKGGSPPRLSSIKITRRNIAALYGTTALDSCLISVFVFNITIIRPEVIRTYVEK